ncbi:GET complex subunit get1 [Mucor velutinosus]|uniref:GET complex subunit get1 n=1 Tax=Mucor velutinosus TaxID=708070 RepID=A0AAN7DIN8_9FUNG|nr:GET complex subunit get1 [Mucor velutinosus]
MAPSTATTTQLNGHYANQYPNQNDKLPLLHLPHNKAYTRYAPNIIIALSSLYVVSFLLHYIIRKCRKYRDRKLQREKQHLKQAWKKTMAKFELQSKHNLLLYPDSAYNKEQSYNSSASSITLNYSSCTSPTSPSITATPVDISSDKKHCHQPHSPSSSLSSFATTDTAAGNSIQLANHHPIIVEPAFTEKVASINRESMRHDDRPSRHMFGSNKLANYWKINNNKRLNLLWQWSVALGYCEYSHAKYLDDMVRQLQRYNIDVSTTVNRERVVLEDE